MTKPVVFLTAKLLPASETFIRAQSTTLQEFTPYYVGSRRVKGLSLPSERTFVVNQGGLSGNVSEGVYKLFGITPSLYYKLRELQPALIHAHFGPCGTLALPLAKKLKLPMIVTFHGADATMKDEYTRKESVSHRIYLHRRERLKREARLFIAVSEFIKQKLLEQGFPSEKVIAHSIGIDTQTFQPDLKVPREPVVLFVGRLAEKKGCSYLIQAMAKVQSQMPDVELVIVGDGDLRSQLEEMSAKLLKRYRFEGMQPPEVVRSWMNRAMLLAVPSVTAASGNTEGLPTVAVEAQAMGLPIVGSLHAGIPQAVIDGETGFLAPERDWEGLAEYILRLFQDQVLWQSFSFKGYERMREFFDLNKQTRTLEGIYKAVLQGEV